LPSDISGQPVCGFYDVQPQYFGKTTGGDVKQASTFGKRTQIFNGVDLTLAARLPRGLQVQGGASIGRTTTDDCSVVVDSPEKRDGFCNVVPTWGSGTQVKFLVVYPLPWEIQTSVIYQNVSGIPITASYVASNLNARTTVDPATGQSLGRNLTSCTGTTGTCTQTVTVELMPSTLQYESRLHQMDLRFAKTFPLGGTRRFRGSMDVLNLFNSNNILRINTRIGGTTPWQNVLQVLTGRLIKFGLQFDF
jgi:hypothetical protein